MSDFPAACRLWTDPIVVKHTLGAPSTDQRTWLRILAYLGHWDLMGFGYWAIEERETGQFIGELGFANFRRDMTPSLGDTPELGWALLSSHHRKGYATEALLAAIQWGDENLRNKNTAAIIDPDNIASIKVAVKVGYKLDKEVESSGRKSLLYRRPFSRNPNKS